MTLDEAATFLGYKNPRSLLRKMKEDPTLPGSKKTGHWTFIQADLERWLRTDYADAAKQLISGEESCIEGNPVASGTSALAELERRHAQGTASGQRSSSTSETRKPSTSSTAS